MTDATESDENRQFVIDRHEVIRHIKSGKLWHVTARLTNVDRDELRYEIQCDTHTERDLMYEEDVLSEFERIGVVVKSRKPRHRLDGRLYDDE
ncbi:hypothetical protein [Halococcus sp. AFM35]|uniref:hypothetical protein n=1 Tax=Halococcus sp. AFM35 TaxID=3421653 RepID=UPI003EBD87B0